MKALVYKSTGNWYNVKTESGEFLRVRLRGKFKIEDITSTNPIAVGDVVSIDKPEDEENIVITAIHERRNYINRVSPHNKNQHHIVAANMDQSVLFATLKDPKTSTGFIDRFLVTCESYHIPAIVVFNKSDIYRDKELRQYEALESIYKETGYHVFLTSVKSGEGLNEIRDLLKDKTTLLSGHSGVGKSTYINFLFPDRDLKTKEVSGWSGKGMHTTTFAEMFDLPHGGRIIDTPGIREMGLVDMPRTELSHYFPEMRKVISKCKYNDCLHVDETECGVKEALLTGEVSESRYISYLKILDTIEESW